MVSAINQLFFIMRSRQYSIFDMQGVQTFLFFKYKQKSQITPLKVKFY